MLVVVKKISKSARARLEGKGFSVTDKPKPKAKPTPKPKPSAESVAATLAASKNTVELTRAVDAMVALAGNGGTDTEIIDLKCKIIRDKDLRMTEVHVIGTKRSKQNATSRPS